MDSLDGVFNSLDEKKYENSRSESLKQKIQWAIQMRKRPTKAERKLKRALQPFKSTFRIKNQHVLFGYIADFAFIKSKIIVEVDGPSHIGNEIWDKNRDLVFRKHGWRTMRFTNQQVLQDIETVLKRIGEALGYERKPI
jgi:very-short-patch-repair endonuclease